MDIIVRNQLFVKTNNKAIIDALKKALTFSNPVYSKMLKMGLSVYNTPITIQCYNPWNEGLAVPRGTGYLVRNIANQYGESKINIIDERTCNNKINIFRLLEITPYWYQDFAVECIKQKQQGIVVAGCGAGKSYIGMFLIDDLKEKTLIVVHTSELFKQWIKEIKENFGGKYTLGQYGLGQKTIGDITVAMVQTLVRNTPKQWAEFRKQFSITILDESHHAGADSYTTVMENIQSKWILGLTATPKRRDQKNFLVSSYLGDVIYTITDKDLEDNGRLVTCKVKMFNTGCKFNYTQIGRDAIKFSTLLSSNIKRNEIIAEKISQDIELGHKPMVLVERKLHANMLQAMLEEKGHKVGVITGDIPTIEREKIRGQLESNKINVLLANKAIAAEGLNIPCLDSIHVAFSTFHFDLIKQMVGRGRRTYKNKEYCQVWYYTDNVVENTIDENTLDEVEVEAEKFKYGYTAIIGGFKKMGFDVILAKENHEKNIQPKE